MKQTNHFGNIGNYKKFITVYVQGAPFDMTTLLQEGCSCDVNFVNVAEKLKVSLLQTVQKNCTVVQQLFRDEN